MGKMFIKINLKVFSSLSIILVIIVITVVVVAVNFMNARSVFI